MGGLLVSLNFDVTIVSPNFAQTVVMAPGAATLLTVAGVAFVGTNVPAATLATALAPFIPSGSLFLEAPFSSQPWQRPNGVTRIRVTLMAGGSVGDNAIAPNGGNSGFSGGYLRATMTQVPGSVTLFANGNTVVILDGSNEMSASGSGLLNIINGFAVETAVNLPPTRNLAVGNVGGAEVAGRQLNGTQPGPYGRGGAGGSSPAGVGQPGTPGFLLIEWGPGI